MHAWRRIRFSFVAGLSFVALVLTAVPHATLLFVFALPAFSVTYASLALFSLGIAVLFMRRHQWMAAAIECAFAGLVGVAFVYPDMAIVPLRTLSAYGQLAWLYPKFTSALAARSAPDQPRLLVLETDGFLSWGSGIAYDDSGEIQKQPGSQSEDWRNRVGSYPLSSKCWQARHLIGNYYAWDGDYACDSPAT